MSKKRIRKTSECADVPYLNMCISAIVEKRISEIMQRNLSQIPGNFLSNFPIQTLHFLLHSQTKDTVLSVWPKEDTITQRMWFDTLKDLWAGDTAQWYSACLAYTRV
jgi:hypothetical protein